MPHHPLLESALDAVAHASAVCRHVQARLDSARAITKDDRSPVTIADFASQAVVASILLERLGAIVLVAEESSDFLRGAAHAPHLDTVVAALRDSGAWADATADLALESIDLGAGDPLGPLARREGFWTLDPIDGTKGFLRAQQYAISLAFIAEGRPVLGVLGCPNLSPDPGSPLDPPHGAAARGSICWATLGGGAHQRPFVGEISTPAPAGTIRCRSSIDSPRLAESVESAHSDQSRSRKVMASLGHPAEPLRLDSQAKYAVVARGQADVYLRLPAESGPRAVGGAYVERIWDHAAGAIIAQEAGCTVTDTLGKPLDFSRGRGLEQNRGVVCAAPSLHARLIRAIAAVHPPRLPA